MAPPTRKQAVATVVVEDIDILLRAAGYQIESRPEKGMNLWSRGGRVYQQNIALKIVMAERKKALKDLESL